MSHDDCYVNVKECIALMQCIEFENCTDLDGFSWGILYVYFLMSASQRYYYHSLLSFKFIITITFFFYYYYKEKPNYRSATQVRLSITTSNTFFQLIRTLIS